MLKISPFPVLPFVKAIIYGFLILSVGCTTAKDKFALDETPAAQIYNEALALRAKGDFKRATERFDDLDRLYPYSEYARRGLINLCYLYYQQKKYAEAITAAQKYLQTYPNEKDAAYALYIMGQSYFDQMPDVMRDQTVAQNAYDTFTHLIKEYPDSEYVKDAEFKRRVARDQLAGKQMHIGRYYLKRRNYAAAIARFRIVVEEYQDTRHVEEALYRLTEAYYALGIMPEAQTAAAVLGHNFAQTDWYRDAYALLKKGGYAPEETKDSWIARAFHLFGIKEGSEA